MLLAVSSILMNQQCGTSRKMKGLLWKVIQMMHDEAVKKMENS